MDPYELYAASDAGGKIAEWHIIKNNGTGNEEDDDEVGILWMRHISPEIAQGIIDYLNTAKEEE